MNYLRAYYAASAADFLQVLPAAVLGELVMHHHPFAVDPNQRSSWRTEIEHLREVASALPDSYLFLEFAIPRMGKRADVVIVVNGIVFVVEYKVGAEDYQKHALDQVLDYALDLKNFHAGSHNRTIVPILVATNASARDNVTVQKWSDDIVLPVCANLRTLVPAIQTLLAKLGRNPIDVDEWAASPYKPTPTIVEAAQALYQGHDVREISRSEAGAENLSHTAAYVAKVIEDAKNKQIKAICFVTGVPGSGKTLAGLNIANGYLRGVDEEHAVFLSGNGPLVAVLREALAIDEVERSKAISGKGVSKKGAYRHASAFIQNIHHFRDEYVRTADAPTERVVVFDEAQRAWGEEHASRFMQKRGHSEFNMSEPQFLMSVMDRHAGGCVVVCLIGGGQEINTGEAGLLEWLTAVEQNYPHWQVHLSDRLTQADYLGGSDIPLAMNGLSATKTPELHLSVPVRSFRAEVVSDFVGAIIEGNDKQASSLSAQLSNYPLALTRDLEAARTWLRQNARGTERSGLVASSNALRLKPVGLHVKAKIDPPVWFLADKTDVRSSYALEDVATEFDIQGLELDWVGVCWDANFRREGNKWGHYNFRGARWERIKDPTRSAYLANAYRVLLTRARQELVIFVPHGSEIDHTRKPAFYDETYMFLRDCGVSELA